MVADGSENGDFVTLEWVAVVVLNQRKSQKRRDRERESSCGPVGACGCSNNSKKVIGFFFIFLSVTFFVSH